MNYVVGVDIGTQGTKTHLYDQEGRCLGCGLCRLQTASPASRGCGGRSGQSIGKRPADFAGLRAASGYSERKYIGGRDRRADGGNYRSG